MTTAVAVASVSCVYDGFQSVDTLLPTIRASVSCDFLAILPTSFVWFVFSAVVIVPWGGGIYHTVCLV